MSHLSNISTQSRWARSDPQRRQWYTPHGDQQLIERWGSTARSQARAYLKVPFSDNELARSRGAKWDRGAKLWYDPSEDKRLTQR